MEQNNQENSVKTGQIIKNYVNTLSEFRRKSSSEGERKAIEYITSELGANGIKYKREPFFWSNKPITLIRIISICILLLGTINYLIATKLFPLYLKEFYSDTIYPCLLIIIVLIFVYWKKNILFLHLGKKSTSENIIAKIAAKNTKTNQQRPLLVCSAHYDAKSSNYPSSITAILILSGFILSSLVDLINPNFFYVIVIITVILWNFRDSNNSPGSVDNASGVGVLLELANHLNVNPLENIDVIFLWCGAEEMGLWGSRYFSFKLFNEYSTKYDLDHSYNINIDMVGNNICLPKMKKRDKNIYKIIEIVAEQLRIPTKRSRLLSLYGSDHAAFRSFAKKFKSKFAVCQISSKKCLKFIHSKRDIIDRYSKEALTNCFKLGSNTLTFIDRHIDYIISDNLQFFEL